MTEANHETTPAAEALPAMPALVVPVTTKDFSSFNLPPKLLQALARIGFKSPTPIQEQAIPKALAGHDILGSAQTGTGKTGAFGIPLIAKLLENPQATATQDIKTALLIGGEPMPKQYHQLHRQPRLIVGTPGRINDHLTRHSLKLNNTRFLVLDETDRMLDLGFGVQIEKIVAHIPAERQTMLFSATLPQGIVKLANKYLKNPERIKVGSTTDAEPNIQQELIHTTDAEKYGTLL